MTRADVDVNNVVRQRASNNGTDGAWRNGPLEKASLHAYDADRVTMQACWAGQPESTATRLWFASDNDTLEEFSGLITVATKMLLPTTTGSGNRAGPNIIPMQGSDAITEFLSTAEDLSFRSL
jgi:hypothetical protein